MNYGYDYRELMVLFFFVRIVEWIDIVIVWGEFRSRDGIGFSLLFWKYGLKYKSMGLLIVFFNLLGCNKINKVGDYYLWMLFFFKVILVNIIEIVVLCFL